MARKFLFRLFLFTTLLIIIGVVLIPKIVSAVVGPGLAFNIGLPFGGKVITILPLTCPDGIEGFEIAPIIPKFLPGPYYIAATTKRYLNFTVTPGSWVLGLYKPVPTTCATDTLPPVPVLALPVKIFGSSLR